MAVSFVHVSTKLISRLRALLLLLFILVAELTSARPVDVWHMNELAKGRIPPSAPSKKVHASPELRRRRHLAAF
ncbi:hypothetical protein HPP92_024057 [Vanilla planifolia]|uniref:Uncharacterized protein n=1 Tax=Vanilla planifolia TaxID=51239 RepID=A0A835UB70_VANPL|nr:hypothetical protein HPP92_024057 [Vanilla planifolia]